MYLRHTSRSYKAGYGWPAIALPVVIGAVLLVSFMPDRVMNWLPSVHVIRRGVDSPCVLTVGGTRAQRDAVARAAESNGLETRFATEAADAIQVLRSQPCSVRAAVIDSAVSNHAWLFQELRTAYPGGRIATFNSQTPPDQMNGLLPKPTPAKGAANAPRK
jgi:hypothetical protein